jgi:membrane-associated phospholipid phosphatase
MSADARPGAEQATSPWLAESLHELDGIDQATYRAVAATASPTLDTALSWLSTAADHSKLWLAIAGVLALRDGRPRRAAVLGVASVGLASATVNIAAKRLLSRARPDQAAAMVPAARRVRMPASGSFPSGHAASAFAFAAAVGSELPAASFPLHLLAAAVAYSRVHTGVHYPADVVFGSLAGTAAAAVVRYGARKRRASHSPALAADR